MEIRPLSDEPHHRTLCQHLRTKGHLRREPVDHWVISYCARGAHFARAADTQVEVPARVPYLWSLGQEFLDETKEEALRAALADVRAASVGAAG